MSDELLDRLARENPQPQDMAPLPIEPVLRRLDDVPAGTPRGSPAGHARWRRAIGELPVAGALLATVAIVAVAIIFATHWHSAAPPGDRTTHLDPVAQLTSQFAVFARPQTTKDRTLPRVLRRAVRLGDLGPGFGSLLDGSISSLTRFTETLPDGREVFLAVYHPGTPPAQRRTADESSFIILRLIIVQPNGKWTDGQPVLDPGIGTTTAGDAYLQASAGRQGCGLDTYWNLVPNQVARIRWQFGRQDTYGYVYQRPLTIDIPVRGNVAVATIPERAPCDRPTVVTLYGRHGQILSDTGNAANLDRITRPIRHGNPLAGLERLQQRP